MNIVKFTATEKNGNKYEEYTKRLRNVIYFSRFFIYNYTLVQFHIQPKTSNGCNVQKRKGREGR